MSGVTVLSIRARHDPTDNFWWAWVSGDERPLRRVRSLDQVRGIMQEFECSRVDWPNGSYSQMVDAGVAPADPPPWLGRRPASDI